MLKLTEVEKSLLQSLIKNKFLSHLEIWFHKTRK